MKKCIIAVFAMLLMAALLCFALGEDEKPAIVTTIFPIYDWTRNITGDDANITLLLDSGVDLHSFQPTAADILKIAACDAFIYVGGESDEWVEDALNTSVNPDLKALSLLEMLGDGIKTEEIIEGMEHEHEHDEDEHDEDEHEHEAEADEHVWLSLRNARALVIAIAEGLGEIDPAHAGDYRANAAAYCERLAALDAEYAAAIAGAKYKTLLFGDRFPFRYMTDDYGLNYYAAFTGCSAETEASFETVAFLAGKLDELVLPAVMTIEGTDHRIAETIVQNAQSNAAILTLDSMQGINNGNYLDIMAQNLETLKRALN